MNDFSPNANAQTSVDRRTLLRTTGVLGLALGAAPLLAACSGSSPSEKSAGGPPRRGGTLRVGMVGSGKSESLNPSGTISALINIAYCGAIFDSLVRVTPNLEIAPWLAEKWESDESSKTWTLQLREGVSWHDGAPLTPDDIIYTLNWASDPENNLVDYTSNIDLGGMKATGSSTVIIPLKESDLVFLHTLAVLPIIKKGTTKFDSPVGTGPFIYSSFTPGRQGSFLRNQKYWKTGRPYVDKLVIQSIPDDTARLNALQGGQIDVMAQVPFTQAKTLGGQGMKLLNVASTAAHAFYMAVDQKPFTDPRVRQAIRLLADRKQLVDVALNGYGTIGNDLYGKGLQFYDESLPQRQRDVAKAKALLADAGFPTGLELELQTSSAVPGMSEAATLFQQQAKEGGVSIKLVNVDPSAYFDPTQKYLKMPFAQTYWAGSSDFASFYELAVLPDGVANETHWDDAETTKQIEQARRAVSPDEAQQLWEPVQKTQYDEGGYLWWGYPNNIDATSVKVAGIKPSGFYTLGLPWSFVDAYFVA